MFARSTPSPTLAAALHALELTARHVLHSLEHTAAVALRAAGAAL